MGWFLAAVIVALVVVVIALAVSSSGVRYVLLAGVLGIGLYLWSVQEQDERRSRLARAAIKVNEIEISDARLSMDAFGKFTATIINHSKFPLKSLTLRISIVDCAEKGVQCRVVGEDRLSQYLTVPVSQMRSMDTYANFSNLPALKNPRWFYRIESVEAGP